MKTKKYLGCLAALAMTLHASAQVAWDTNGNTVVGADWFGADAGSTIPLRIRNDANQPIDFYTTAIQRMKLFPNVSPVINSYPALPRNGSLVLSNLDAGFVPARVPFSRLHLIDVGANTNANFIAAENGFRRWMRNGVTFTGNTDQSYVGAKYAVNSSGAQLADRSDMVLQWSSDVPGDFGPDRLRFIFTSSRNTAVNYGSRSEEGLEAMRFIPINDTTLNAGLGDFVRGNVLDPVNVIEPTERLDILTGRVRIRQLPTDAVSTSNEYVTVNTTTGVLEHRPLPPSTTTGCDWVTNAGSSMVTTAEAPFGTNGACPDAGWMVRMGPAFASNYKLSVRVDQPNCAGCTVNGGTNISMTTDSTASVIGSNIAVSPAIAGATDEIRGLNVATNDAGVYNYAIDATARNTNTSADNVSGAWIKALNSGGGTVPQVYGVRASSVTDITSTTSIGVGAWGLCGNAATTLGILGQGYDGDDTYGVSGAAHGGSNFNYGVHGTASGTGAYAGFFAGDVYSTGSYLPSDSHLKTVIEEESDLGATASGLLSNLPIKRFRYNTEEHPQMHLPDGEQVGFMAQELEAILPHLVRTAVAPASHDEQGNVIAEAVSFKAVNTTGLIPYLIAGHQAQQRELEEMRAQLADMQHQLAACCANPDGVRSLPQGNTQPTGVGSDLTGTDKLHIQPNPFNERTTVYYTVDRGGRAQLLANSSDGRELRVLQEANVEAGSYQFEWDTTSMAPGLYYVTLLVDGEPVVKKAVKVDR